MIERYKIMANRQQKTLADWIVWLEKFVETNKKYQIRVEGF